MRQKKRIINYAIPLYTLLLLIMASCGETELLPADARAIQLGVEGLGQNQTRAAIDEWDETPVSIGYLFAPATVFTRSLTVTVAQNTGEHINTGLEYPTGGTSVSFVGYHPVAAPSALGEVTYDISKGDVDVMLSNRVSGTLSTPVSQSLDYKHKLTRVCFIMQCEPGKTYPEPIYGILTNPAIAASPLLTLTTLNLNTGGVTFKVPGSLFTGSADGYSVPVNGMDPLILDVMFQPGVPVVFTLASLTEVRSINITNDPSGLWTMLQTAGGGEGMQYTVKLSFSGEAILAQGITASTWQSGGQINSTTPVWW